MGRVLGKFAKDIWTIHFESKTSLRMEISPELMGLVHSFIFIFFFAQDWYYLQNVISPQSLSM